MTQSRKKLILRLIAVIAAAVLLVAAVLFFPLTGWPNDQVWHGGDPFSLQAIQTVEKTGEDFRILLFTDTQLWSNLLDNKRCYGQMDELVQRTAPNLIVLPGDNLSAFASRFSIANFIRHMDAYGVPWAPVFGNHDSEIPTTSRNWQAEQYMKSPGCLMEKGPSNLRGCGNYVVNITENGAPVYSLFFFDNGEYIERADGTTGESDFSEAQLQWYQWNVNGMTEAVGRVVPSMVFSHFASPEMRRAVETYGRKTEDGGYEIPAEYGFGACAYLPGAAPEASRFADICRELGSTEYFFCGHDHENNASITVDGITYTYGLKTGPSPAPWNHAEETGGTLVTIRTGGAKPRVTIEHIVVEKTEA